MDALRTSPDARGAYSDFTWDWTCFHGVDWDDRAKRKAVFLFDGKHWDAAADCTENGSYDYLMGADVDVNDPRVYEELCALGLLVCGHLRARRLPLGRAEAHRPRLLFALAVRLCASTSGRELFCVGEYWGRTVEELQAYLGEERTMSLFDVPLHYNLYRASCSNGDVDLSRIF